MNKEDLIKRLKTTIEDTKKGFISEGVKTGQTLAGHLKISIIDFLTKVLGYRSDQLVDWAEDFLAHQSGKLLKKPEKDEQDGGGYGDEVPYGQQAQQT